MAFARDYPSAKPQAECRKASALIEPHGASGLMETVQLQCGQCKKVMAIGVEHLGGQVQCPHCRCVVQTPPRSAFSAAVTEAPSVDANGESIFSPQDATDVVFGNKAAPKVELPTKALHEDIDETLKIDPRAKEVSRPRKPAPKAEEAAEPVDEADLSTLKRERPVYDRGVMPLIAMIFLIPYAIVTTTFIVYLVFFAKQGSNDPYEFLNDPMPNPNKGGAKRVSKAQPVHNHPLLAHRVVPIGKPIQVGDLLVTPERIQLTSEGDLRLILRAKNTSSNTAFEPMSDNYVRYVANRDSKPFTFLESKSRSVSDVLGGYLGYAKALNANEHTGNGYIRPNEQVFVILTTHEAYRAQEVAQIAAKNESFLWRVQLRRGLVKLSGKDVSATSVIGVEFSNAEIVREKKT